MFCAIYLTLALAISHKRFAVGSLASYKVGLAHSLRNRQTVNRERKSGTLKMYNKVY